MPVQRLPVLPVLACSGALLLVACSGPGDDRIAELEEEIVAEAADEADTDTAESQTPDRSELRFEPESMRCSPHKSPVVSGSWQSSAPRVEVEDPPVELGLRDQSGSGDTELSVQVEVYLPDDEDWVTAGGSLAGDDWTYVDFPEDFDPEPSDVPSGVYTAVWSIDGAGERTFLACDGFEVE
ncbi:hypothetical protein [Lipingzhangella rawalii]|nr:hypothetical protein [Lipingzhangella rawalii]